MKIIYTVLILLLFTNCHSNSSKLKPLPDPDTTYEIIGSDDGKVRIFIYGKDTAVCDEGVDVDAKKITHKNKKKRK